MSDVLRRIEIPIAITIIAALLQVIPYYISIPPLIGEPPKSFLLVAADTVSLWMVLIVTMATFVGVVSIVQVHGRRLQRRPEGWYFSILVLVSVIVMALTGLPIPEIGLGIANPIYDFLFTNVQTPLGGTMYSILAFFITSAAFRAFRAKNIESTIVLVAGTLLVLSNAPIFTVTFPPFKPWGTWVRDIPGMATTRAVILGAALGAIALAVRTLMGIERGYLRGGGEE